MSLAPPPVVAERVQAAEHGYFATLEGADEPGAVALATALLDAGVPAQEVLLRLVGPAQVRVGELWQCGRWSVAQEHAATAIAERVVAAVGARTRSCGSRGHVVVSCLDGEWHGLAARLVGEVLRLHDWRVTFLGASVPPVHLVSFLHQHEPDVVALSAALPIHLPAAHHVIAAAQRAGIPVLAGGPGFGADGRYARRLGVDAWAATAPDAVVLLDRRPWPVPAAPVFLDTRTEAEHAALRQRRGSLVVAAMERLRARSGHQVLLADSAPTDDLGQVVDFLATAAHLADRTVFAEHVAWLAAVSPARGAPETALPDLLDALQDELAGFPFARSCLDAARAVCAVQARQARRTAATRSSGESSTFSPRASSR